MAASLPNQPATPQSMAPQKQTRSRRGCRRCKLRRIKCDESRPICDNCKRHNIFCDYQPPVPPSHSMRKVAIPRGQLLHIGGSSTASVYASNDGDVLPQLLPGPEAFHDIDIMSQSFGTAQMEHQLSTLFFTWIALESSVTDKKLFCTVLPPLARSAPWLMDCIIGHSALNLRARTSCSPSVIEASYYYSARAAAICASLMKVGATGSNFETLYLSALFIGSYTINNRQFATRDLDGLRGVVQWFYGYRGAKAIAAAFPKLFSESIIVSNFPAGGWQSPFLAALELPPVMVELEFLMESRPWADEDTEYMAYRRALAFITHIHMFPRRSLHTRFLVDVDLEFVAGVQRLEPIALVIMGIYFALSASVDPFPELECAASKDLELIIELLPSREKDLIHQALKALR